MKKLSLFLSFLFVISCTKDPIIYTLTTSANPADGGTVSPPTQNMRQEKQLISLLHRIQIIYLKTGRELQDHQKLLV